MSKKLRVMEIFESFQGEGMHQGQFVQFLRLQGCDVGCVWCDVKESWDENDQYVAVDEIVKQLLYAPIRTVVITGGEPALQDLSYITKKLHEQNFKIHLETSGTAFLKGEFDWVTFSPKKFKQPNPAIFDQANELKVVVYHSSDFQWAEEYKAKVNANCNLFLQPEWSKQDRILPEIISYCKQNPEWKLSLQTHKFVNEP